MVPTIPVPLNELANAQLPALIWPTTEEAGLDRKLSCDAEALPTLSDDARAILESMSDAFYALDGAWRIIYANRRALEFWGLSAQDVVGRVVWDCLPQLVGTYNETVLRRARAEQRAISFEAPSPVTNIWVQVNVAPSLDGVSVYWRDITERVRAEQTLRASEEHLRLAQEAAGIGTWEWDLATGRTHWSPQMFRLIGRDPTEARDADHYALWRRVVHPDDREAVVATARAHSHRAGPFALEFRILRPDGEIRWINARGNVLPDSSGNPRRMFGVNIDITERKQTEAALEQRVAERTQGAARDSGGAAPIARTLCRDLRPCADLPGVHARGTQTAGSSARMSTMPGSAIPASIARRSWAAASTRFFRRNRRHTASRNIARRSRRANGSNMNTATSSRPARWSGAPSSPRCATP